MGNLKISVVITTNEKSISTEPPGTVEGHCINLFGRKLAHAGSFFRQNYWYDLQRIYDSELKLATMQTHQLE